VERVEILEPGRDGTFGGLCPDGLVYNLSVKGTNTFVADGLVAHNCHTLPADSFWGVAQACPAHYRFGLSGTPLARGDKRSVLAIGALGPVVYRIIPDVLIRAGVLAKPKIRLTSVVQRSERPTWQGVYGESIVRSSIRNKAVVECARKAEKPCLVFVKEIAHGKLIKKALEQAGLTSEFVYGEDDTSERRESIKRLVRGDSDVLVCSVVFQEGIDIPALRSVVIASGGKSVIAALQRIGRGMRKSLGKDEFEVHDIADKGCGCGSRGHAGCRWLEKHTRARVKAYAGEGFQVAISGA
jgi:superfamily II DNA or RNA helicase